MKPGIVQFEIPVSQQEEILQIGLPVFIKQLFVFINNMVDNGTT
jgi:Na+-driven multidrug efflux pump